jgi:protein SCO1/2
MAQYFSFNLKKILWTVSLTLFVFSLSSFIWLHYQIRAKIIASSEMRWLPVYSQLPPFNLTERNGQSLGLKNLEGYIWIADFIFTSCPGPCPMMSSRMAELQHTLVDVAQLRFVSFTVDPETDTPEVLRKYAARYHANSSRWFFLTGDPALIARLANEGFMVGGTENPMMHSTKFILVDTHGQIRGYYDSSDPASLDQMVRDVRFLGHQ